MVDLTVIDGDKHRPFYVTETHDEVEEGEESRPIELAICHRAVKMVMTDGGLVPTNAVVTPPIALADRAIAEAFCEAMNAYHQFWDEFDWVAHDDDEPLPICPGTRPSETA